ncbi:MULTISPECIES: twin-arginine translocase subunit TatC [Thermodesulfovibrio]|jgi:sec-independent protein translocase protein TatC|uniref:Sec-independent protein translocase protein TatC n=2 Tax=Thermodesulfovibrio yellowstonii TaxID=28262 RepID=B5YKH3_THEYD|nr:MULTISPECIES: twin-arginine translocase subunit TatC [Thermodesulfovibrio]ACI20262.1 twin arginine-targeting protein translocase TatC [Thermodesulfovibrio yellowstonii DSM 11347]MDI6865622.1 twin-arginine translocase subunit TatC [Thermodesulfovibrio yellowstonii]GLI53444.1 Sec-independent protein translocase protein TatC [Thermodesulfovibrio islandicus]
MEEQKMSLIEHLSELRKRILVCLIALIIAFIFTFSYSEYIFKLLLFPLNYTPQFSLKEGMVFVPDQKLQNTKLVFLGPAEAFWMNMKIALVTGFILTIPIIFYQLWRFVSPGLYAHEKKYVLPFVLTATGLFLTGVAFCYFIVLPFAMGFLLNYKVGDFLMPMLSVGLYIDFLLKFLLAFGLVFELPILIVITTRMGLITPQTLKKYRRLAIVLAFVVAAIITPTPDAFNQTLMAVPMIILYELGIWVSILLNKKGKNSGGQN